MGIRDMAQGGGQLSLLPAPHIQHTQDPKANVLAMMDKQPKVMKASGNKERKDIQI